MRSEEKPEVPAEIPARSRDGRDENPEESRRAWEAFFADIDQANDDDEVVGKEAA